MPEATTEDACKRRIVHSWDGCTMWGTILSGSPETPPSSASGSWRR